MASKETVKGVHTSQTAFGQAAPRTPRDRIRGNFDRGAGEYAQFETEHSFFAELARGLLELAPPLAGNRILDVGCGCGASLQVLQHATGDAGTVVGFDLSLGMLREAKSRLTPGTSVFVGDACAFGNTLRWVFDAVVYNAVLFMLPDPVASLACARRLLSPGGVVLIASLEGLQVGEEREPIGSVLAARGHTVGRHALTSPETVSCALRRFFVSHVYRDRTLRFTPGEFCAFYGLEPMSAGLLPRLPYPERKTVLEELAGEWDASGVVLNQVWTFTAAFRPRNGTL